MEMTEKPLNVSKLSAASCTSVRWGYFTELIFHVYELLAVTVLKNLSPTFSRSTHLSRRLRNQNPLLGVTSIFPLRPTDCLATPKSQSVFSPTSTCLGATRSDLCCSARLICADLFTGHAPYLPVVSPGGNPLPAQHAEDSVKSLPVVWQHLVVISTTHLIKVRVHAQTYY